MLSKLILCYRISLAPPFPGLRRFKDGRNFSQWTGNDSKALMKASDLSLYFHCLTVPQTVGLDACD
jgi:hypothetical protein